MATTEMNCLASGGGAVSIEADTTQVIQTATKGVDWTATEDCIMRGTVSSSGSTIWIYVNGSGLIKGALNQTIDISQSNYGIFIPKGTTVRIGDVSDYITVSISYYAIK